MSESLKEFMRLDSDGVFYVGHASALVRINKKLFMFDPVWNHKPYGDYWTFYPSQVDCDEILDKVSGIFVSHIHEDHLCDEILKKADCPIYIMDGRGPSLMSRVPADLLAKPFQWFKVEDDIEAYFVPHSFNSIDSSVFIRSKDYCVYIGSDNFLSKELLLKVAPSVPKVDVAMVPYAFIHWYPSLMSNMTDQEKNAETNRLNEQSLQQARDFMTCFRPRVTIPFGSNLFYASGLDHLLNRLLAKPDDLVEDPLLTGDFILSDGNIYRDRTPETFKEKEFPALENHFYPEINESRISRLKEKLSKAQSIGEPHILIINNIPIDLSIPAMTTAFPSNAFITEFNFNEREFYKWFDGEITFEQALGTRRFSCLRSPNQYNLKVFEFMNNYL